MSSGKTSRVTDGPYANWGTDDETGQIVLANLGTLKLGQPLAIDVTQLGPDQNVPNNGGLLPQCERLVAMNSANAGPIFGVLTGITVGLPNKVTLAPVAGIPTWTNNSGAAVTLTCQFRQLGWAYVWAGTGATAASNTNNRAVKIGDPLIVNISNAYAVASNVATGSIAGLPIASCVGTALGTAIKTTEGGIPTGAGAIVQSGLGAPAGPGVVSITPLSLVGLTLNTILLIDSLQSGVQEAVSVGAISYPTFSVALANAHAGNFPITGPAVNAAISTNLISTANFVPITGLVAAYVNTGA